MGVVRLQAKGRFKLVDRVLHAAELIERMTALVVGQSVVGFVLETRGIPIKQCRGRFGELFDLAGERAQVDLKWRQRSSCRCLVRIRGTVPIESHCGELLANGPQIPDMDSLIFTVKHQS